MLERSFAIGVLLFAIPVFAQMRSAKTIFDVPQAQDQLENQPMNTQAPVAPTAAMSADDHQTVSAGCSGATIKIGWLPVGHSSAAAQCFWAQDGTEVLKQAEILNSGGSTAVATEMLSDFVGGIRIAFTTSVATGSSDSDDTTTSAEEHETNVALLRANGGNVALSAAYPIFVNPYAAGEFAAVTYGRIGGVFDALQNTGMSSGSVAWSDLNANAELALTTETTLRTDAGTFNFELYTNAAVIAGTPKFRTAIGADASALFHGEIGANVKIGSMATVGVSWNWFSDEGTPNGATVIVGIGR